MLEWVTNLQQSRAPSATMTPTLVATEEPTQWRRSHFAFDFHAIHAALLYVAGLDDIFLAQTSKL
jgi:hypothetical protein